MRISHRQTPRGKTLIVVGSRCGKDGNRCVWLAGVVINNAGYGNLSSVEDTPMSDFCAQIETNLFGTIIVTKAALPCFRERKAGYFVQFPSIGGRTGPPGRGPYSAAKWGVEGFSEVLSRKWQR
jgi:NAD(P)-dependent dehydrogenase (short-subunit alcohol dehydrogenase family)